jgi:YbbR domain-containing protein
MAAPTRRWRPGWEPLSRLGLAFALAALLWIYVLDQENPAISATYNNIPVTPHGLGSNLNVANDLGTATVTVRAPGDVLARLQAANFQATLDLTGRGAGTYRLPVAVVPPVGVTDASVEPAMVSVQIEELAERRLPVTVRTQGRPGLGYRIQTQQVRPTEVLVRGRRDAVERIDSLVADIDVEGKQGTQTGDVRPKAVDFAGREIADLDFNPAYVNVTIAIQQLLGYKTLPVRVPVEGAPAPGYRVTDITIQPTTLTVYGLPSVLEPLTALETAPVSIGGTTQTVSLDIQVPITNGRTLYPPGTSDRVSVRVAVEEISTKTRLSVLLDKVGLAPGLGAVLSPDRVDVTLSGPFDALQSIKPDSVRATLDLTGYAEGTHRVAPVITLPPHTTLQAVDPGDVTVTISPPATPTVLPPTASPPASPLPPSTQQPAPPATPATPTAPVPSITARP